jgi:DNA polymerase-1
MNLLFDIETDNLLKDVTTMWIFHAKDLDTGEKYTFLQGDEGWRVLLDHAKKLVGHNIINYDLAVLRKLFHYSPPKYCRIVDTLILSQVLDYWRFGPGAGHSLARWGEFLGCAKGDYHDWTHYTEEMLTYCEQDVEVSHKVYTHLMAEFAKKNVDVLKGKLKRYLEIEHTVADFVSRANEAGWAFDLDKATVLRDSLQLELDNAYLTLETKLGWKITAPDACKGEVKVHHPLWIKNGNYNHHQAKWFDIDPIAGNDPDPLMDGPYTKCVAEKLSLNSVYDVKLFLHRLGWKPMDWNYKMNPETGKKEKSSPKITLESLEFLGGDGALYMHFLTVKSRHAVVNTWIKECKNGRVHGDCMLVGTPSMRSRHSIIVNVPASTSAYGKEMRELFMADPGYVLIGADSSGNQARSLAHYLDNEDFTNTLLSGDIHAFNAANIDKVLTGMGISWDEYLIDKGAAADEKHTLEEVLFGKKRGAAKRILYAFLFGAAGGKLWSYIFGTQDSTLGNEFKDGFTKSVPGFEGLLKRLNDTFVQAKKKGDPYIPSLAGNRIYVDSKHKLLVYLLQSAEKITCMSAVAWMMQKFEEEGIEYKPCIIMHDECQFMVLEKDATRAAELAALAFAEGPKQFNVMIMAGEAKIGHNWQETH